MFSHALGRGWKTTNYDDYFEDTDDVNYSVVEQTRPPSMKGPSIVRHASDASNDEKRIGYVIDAVKNMEYVADDTKDITEEDSSFMSYISVPSAQKVNEVMRVKDQVKDVQRDMKNMKVDMKVMKGEVEMVMEDLNEMKRTHKKMMRIIAKMNGDMKGMKTKITGEMEAMEEEIAGMQKQKHSGTLSSAVWNEGETKMFTRDETGSWNFQS